jgi:hypothetical protein
VRAFRVPEVKESHACRRDIGYALAGLTAVGIIFIGARFLLAPSTPTAGFRDCRLYDGGKPSYLSVKGVRDIASGLAPSSCSPGCPVLGWFELAASTIPIGDAIIVLQQRPRPPSTACGAKAVVLLATAALYSPD